MPITSPSKVIDQLLHTGAKVNAREVEGASRALRSQIALLDSRSQDMGTTSASELSLAADVLERVGQEGPLLRNPAWPAGWAPGFEEAVVTGTARGVATRHGALLRTLLEQSPGTGRMSHGELARHVSLPVFDEVCADLARLSPTSVPHDPSVKLTRKKLLKLRDMMDIFVHAYARGDDEKTWKSLRERLDEGYERLGTFKDLFDGQGLTLIGPAETPEPGQTVRAADVEYVAAELAARRADVLTFRDGFLDVELRGRLRGLLDRPSPQPAEVKRENLPRFFWGGLDLAPRADERGLHSVRALAAGMSDYIRDELATIDDLKEIRRKQDEDVVHDARKRMRSLGNILTNFLELSPVTSRAQESRQTLVEAVARYGELSDTFIAIHLAHERGKSSLERDLWRRADEQWDELRTWQDEQGVRDALRALSHDLRAQQ